MPCRSEGAQASGMTTISHVGEVMLPKEKLECWLQESASEAFWQCIVLRLFLLYKAIKKYNYALKNEGAQPPIFQDGGGGEQGLELPLSPYFYASDLT